MDFLSKSVEKIDGSDDRRLRNRLVKAFIILCLIFGLLFIMIEAPFAVSDEDVHYANICRILHGRLIPDVEDGRLGSYLTGDEHAFVEKYCERGNSSGISGGTFYHPILSKDIHIGPHDFYEDGEHSCTDAKFFEHSASGINALSYAVPVAVLSVVKLFTGGINPYNILMISRIATLFLYVIVTAIALYKTRVFRKTMFLLALMPMTIFQGASISYDAALISCFFLLFAYLSRFWFDEDARVRVEDIVVIALAVTVIVCVKIGYSPIALVLLSIPFKRYKSKGQYFLCIGCVLGALVLTHGIHNLAMNVMVRPYATNMLTEAQIAQREYFAENFYKFPKIILNTFVVYGWEMASGFVGILGWMDIAFPRPFVVLFLIVIILVAVSEAGDIGKTPTVARVLSLCSFFAFLFACLCTMYISWTPVSMESVGGDIIHGFQGRYFIPYVLFVLVAISSPLWRHLKISHKLNEAVNAAVIPCALVGLVSTGALLALRYFT